MSKGISEVRKVTLEEAASIIETRLPHGLFYVIEKNVSGGNIYVGIDNQYGDAWTKDFRSLSACKRWLIKG